MIYELGQKSKDLEYLKFKYEKFDTIPEIYMITKTEFELKNISPLQQNMYKRNIN